MARLLGYKETEAKQAVNIIIIVFRIPLLSCIIKFDIRLVCNCLIVTKAFMITKYINIQHKMPTSMVSITITLIFTKGTTWLT